MDKKGDEREERVVFVEQEELQELRTAANSQNSLLRKDR
jgi:hypothetical protein